MATSTSGASSEAKLGLWLVGVSALLPLLFAMPLLSEVAMVRAGHQLAIFRYLLTEDVKAVLPYLASGVLGWALPLSTRGLPIFAWLSDHVRLLSALTFLACLTLCVFSYHRHPLTMDESVPVFQARLFAAGQLVGKYDPDLVEWLFFPPFLRGFFFSSLETGQVISVYWPGFALALAPFELFGVGFLLNPLLAGASVWLLRNVALELTGGDRFSTGVALAILLCSPAFLINAASFYSMNAHLFANLAFVALLVRPTSGRLVLAGVIGAWALSLHNPFPHLLFAWPFWLAQLFERDRWRRVFSLALGYLPLGLVLVVGYYVYRNGIRTELPLGKGVGPLVWPGSQVFEYRLLGLGKLVLWAPFATLPLAVWGAVQARRQRLVQCLVASALSTLLGYFFVRFDQGHGWGYRYFHPAYATLPLLAALPFRAKLMARAPVWFPRAMAVWLAFSLLILVPLRAIQVEGFIARHLAQLATAPAPPANCVHFVSALGYYSQDLIQNDPWLEGSALFLADHGYDQNQRLLRRYFPEAKFAGHTQSDTLYCGGSLAPFRRAALKL